MPPSQRVQFILGEEQADGEDGDTHESHPLFSEMEELCFNQDGETEWNETARYIAALLNTMNDDHPYIYRSTLITTVGSSSKRMWRKAGVVGLSRT